MHAHSLSVASAKIHSSILLSRPSRARRFIAKGRTPLHAVRLCKCTADNFRFSTIKEEQVARDTPCSMVGRKPAAVCSCKKQEVVKHAALSFSLCVGLIVCTSRVAYAEPALNDTGVTVSILKNELPVPPEGAEMEQAPSLWRTFQAEPLKDKAQELSFFFTAVGTISGFVSLIATVLTNRTRSMANQDTLRMLQKQNEVLIESFDSTLTLLSELTYLVPGVGRKFRGLKGKIGFISQEIKVTDQLDALSARVDSNTAGLAALAKQQAISDGKIDLILERLSRRVD